MSWSAGTFSRTGGSTAWGDDRDAATEIEAGLHDTHDEDLAQGINDCLHKGGQNAATADISMGTNKLTNLGTPTAAADAATKAYVDASPLAGAASGDEFLGRIATTPTGWTVSAVSNKALRIVTGTPGSDGGTVAFTTVFSTARTTNSDTHNHALTVVNAAPAGSGVNVPTATQNDSHSHTSNLNVQYRDFNIFAKS